MGRAIILPGRAQGGMQEPWSKALEQALDRGLGQAWGSGLGHVFLCFRIDLDHLARFKIFRDLYLNAI